MDGTEGSDGQVLRRRAARVLCFDRDTRVLLLRWKDPVGGQLIWEPPGGGVEPGEDDLKAARRELEEETGRVAALNPAWRVEVERDFTWAGRRFRGPEVFFGLEVGAPFEPTPAALTESEETTLVGHRWFGLEELGEGREQIEPPDLAGAVRTLLEERHRSRLPR